MARKSKRTIPNQHLKQQREAHNWSQQHLAEHIGTNAFTIGRWERGTSAPNSHFRTKLRDLFHLDDKALGFNVVGKASSRPLTSSTKREDALKQSLPPVYAPAIPPCMLIVLDDAWRIEDALALKERLDTMLEAHRKLPNSLLRNEREIRCWTQSYVAERVDTNPFTISRWEKGTTFPSPKHRLKLCELFGKSAAELGLLPPAIDEEQHIITLPDENLSPIVLYDPAIPHLPHLLVGRKDMLVALKHFLLYKSHIHYKQFLPLVISVSHQRYVPPYVY